MYTRVMEDLWYDHAPSVMLHETHTVRHLLLVDLLFLVEYVDCLLKRYAVLIILVSR